MRLQLCLLVKARESLAKLSIKYFSKMESRRGLILGLFTDTNSNSSSDLKKVESQKEIPLLAEQFTACGKRFNDETNGGLLKQLNCSEPLQNGKHRILYGLTDKYNAIAIAGLGKKGAGIDLQEQYHVGRENVRNALAGAARALKDIGCKSIDVDPCGYPTSAAEGVVLSLFSYDELKSQNDGPKPKIKVNLVNSGEDSRENELFEDGVILAEGQNLSRKLMEMPANILTPTKFGEVAQELAIKEPSMKVIIHDKAWAEKEKMFSFLSVSQGSAEPPIFLELRLKSKENSNKPPVVLVGKGVCFDSGGISLKPSSNMDKMRADMGGAANVLATIYTLSRLNIKLPFDVIGLAPMVENMPGSRATKPGDIVFAKNGKSIKIDNTDAEGRLILADALCYADTFKPSHVIDIATLTGAMIVSLGNTATGVFCTNDKLWEKILTTSIEVGDRVWRLPLFKAYNAKMKCDCADLNNIAKANVGAGSCVAAGFLKEFVECKSWAHMDIAGVCEADGDLAYIPKGMTGRPLRLLVNLVESLSE